MMPVEATAARSREMPTVSRRTTCCIARATSSPFCPVQALALPLLMATARSPPGIRLLTRDDDGRRREGVGGGHLPEEAVSPPFRGHGDDTHVRATTLLQPDDDAAGQEALAER